VEILVQDVNRKQPIPDEERFNRIFNAALRILEDDYEARAQSQIQEVYGITAAELSDLEMTLSELEVALDWQAERTDDEVAHAWAAAMWEALGQQIVARRIERKVYRPGDATAERDGPTAQPTASEALAKLRALSGSGAASDVFEAEARAAEESIASGSAGPLHVSSATPGMVQRTPRKPEVDPRFTPGHRDPLHKQPEGPPLVEVESGGARSVSWSWEVERPGTAATGGQPFREQVYWANFQVDKDGVMTGSARMVSPSGQFRAPEWTLKGKFKEAIETFRKAGIEVKAFDAEWSYMSKGEMSGNLDAYFKHLRDNPKAKATDAARATPSGKAALDHGFSHVSEPAVSWENQPHLQGKGQGPQVRAVVRVRFALPGASLPPPPWAPAVKPPTPTKPPTVAAPKPPTPSKPPTPPKPSTPPHSTPNPKINLADYPPDSSGPVVGRFKDGAAIRNVTTGVQTLTTALSLGTDTDISFLGAVEWHFNGEISAAQKELDRLFPDTSQLRGMANLEALAKAYTASITSLNMPSGALQGAIVLIAIGPGTDKEKEEAIKRVKQNYARTGGPHGQGRWQSYVDSATAYMEAIFEIQKKLGDTPWQLPDIGADIEKRAAVITRAGNEVEETFWNLMSQGAVAVPVVYYQSLELLHVAHVLTNLGGRVAGLGASIQGRAGSYQYLWNQLETDLRRIGKDAEALSQRYGIKLPTNFTGIE